MLCVRMRSCLLAAVLVAAACAGAPPAPRPPLLAATPPDGSLAAIERTRDRFVARAATAGVALPFTPEMREWTRPSIISWREEQRAVAVPRWEELSEAQRAAIADLAGSPAGARPLFAWLFRWFFVAHELAHALQSHAHDEGGHAQGERFANDVAVAFYMEEPGGPEHLATLEAILAALEPGLAPLPPDADAYFDAHYDELGQDARLYGAYQLRFVQDSLRRRHELDFDALVGGLAATPRPTPRSPRRRARRTAARRRSARAADRRRAAPR
jgi:hypothetical protein